MNESEHSHWASDRRGSQANVAWHTLADRRLVSIGVPPGLRYRRLYAAFFAQNIEWAGSIELVGLFQGRRRYRMQSALLFPNTSNREDYSSIEVKPLRQLALPAYSVEVVPAGMGGLPSDQAAGTNVIRYQVPVQDSPQDNVYRVTCWPWEIVGEFDEFRIEFSSTTTFFSGGPGGFGMGEIFLGCQSQVSR